MNTARDLTEEYDARLFAMQYQYGWDIAHRNYRKDGVTKNYFPIGSSEHQGYRAYRQFIGVEQE